MKLALEIFAEIMLDMAMLMMIFNLIRKQLYGSAAERLTAASMGVGFLIYCISKVLCNGSYVVFVLAMLGVMLSYTAFVFAFSRE